MLKKLFILSVVAVGLVACSNNDNNDAEEYNRYVNDPNKVRLAGQNTPPEDVREEVVQTVMQSLFYVNPKGSLTFVQGQRKRVDFDVRLAFAELEGLRYNLVMEEGPSNLGARFQKDSRGQFYFEWNPRNGIINNQENFKTYKIKLRFDLESDPSHSSREELAGQDLYREFWVTLLKDSDQPIIESVSYSSEDQILNPNMTGTIDVTVSAKNLRSRDDLELTLRPGPQTPAHELVQLDGARAVTELKYIGEGAVKEGRKTYRFRLTFNANAMIDYAKREIEKDSTLRGRRANGRLEAAEGLFSVVAVNHDNSMSSQTKILMYKVNLDKDEAGVPFLGGLETVNTKRPGFVYKEFFMSSAGGKGTIDVTAETPDFLNFECRHNTANANREYGCLGGGSCLKTCIITGELNCDVATGTLDIPIKAISKLYDSEKENDFKIRIYVGDSQYCAGGQQ